MGIGERIRRRRVELGFTRNELAEKVHVTPSAVANYENNISIPKLELLISLMNTLEVDANYLYADYISNPTVKKVFRFEMNEEEQEALEKYRGLTENGKRLVRIVINEEYERVKSQRMGCAAVLLSGSTKNQCRFSFAGICKKGSGKGAACTKRDELLFSDSD